MVSEQARRRMQRIVFMITAPFTLLFVAYPWIIYAKDDTATPVWLITAGHVSLFVGVMCLLLAGMTLVRVPDRSRVTIAWSFLPVIIAINGLGLWFYGHLLTTATN